MKPATTRSTSDDGLHWQKHGVVVPNGANNHVNDPSVVRVGGTFYMFYTTAPEGIDDVISLATSPDGWNWTIVGNVLLPDPNLTWETVKVGRPAVLHEDGVFKMWYDGTREGGYRTVGYAESVDGITWTRHVGNPIVDYPLGAIDIEHIGDTYFLVCEAGDGVLWTSATNETNFDPLTYLFKKTGLAWDRYGHVTPFILAIDDAWVATYVGVTTHDCWCHNRIGVWFPAMNVTFHNSENTQIIPDRCYMTARGTLACLYANTVATREDLHLNTGGSWNCKVQVKVTGAYTTSSPTQVITHNAKYLDQDADKLENQFWLDREKKEIRRV